MLKRLLSFFRGGGTETPAPTLRAIGTRDEVLAELKAFVSARSRRKIPVEAIDPAEPMLERGYLDSLAIVTLLGHIERTYGVTIRAIQLGGALRTLGAIVDFVMEKRTAGGEAPRPALVPFHVPATRATNPVFVPESSTIERSQMTELQRLVSQRTGMQFADAAAFHTWTVDNYRMFWKLFLEWSKLEHEGEVEPVCEGSSIETTTFFPRLRLNYTRALLRDLGDDTAPALTACNELGEVKRLTRGELRRRVGAVAARLRELGLARGERVVALVRNDADALIACLATAAIGGIWSSVSPDLGRDAILARFEQLEPKLLFACSHYLEQGRRIDIRDRLREVVAGLPSVQHIVTLGDEPWSLPADRDVPQTALRDMEAVTPLEIDKLEMLPFNHPLFIMFSSGTTGRPKCIVHGAGGTLIEHHKEHRLHCDLRPDDKLYFHTTCAWMMWNWLISALAVGTEIVVYDGAVSYPDTDALWQLVARERVTMFGTSPAFLQFTQTAGVVPKDRADLSKLRAMFSTGAVLPDTAFDWIKSDVAAVPMQSISGGTDIIGCFLLGHPNLPVYAGELQSKSLAMDVRAHGASAAAPIGELVCANPFPSRPLGFHGDPDGQRFHDAYFAQNEGLWTHGDRFEWTARGTGRIHGRSDGVMNVRGVRIGPAEIYSALAAVDGLKESMAVEYRAADQGADGRILLLVVLDKGRTLDAALASTIRETVAARCSLAHVPDTILQVTDVPQTHNGKRAERAARDAANGQPVANLQALKNPACLDEIRSGLASAPF